MRFILIGLYLNMRVYSIELCVGPCACLCACVGASVCVQGHLSGNSREQSRGCDQEMSVSECRSVSVLEGQHTNDMCSTVEDKESGGKSSKVCVCV